MYSREEKLQSSYTGKWGLRMDLSIISSVGLPAIAIIISLVSIYINSLHRSVDLAKKYSELCVRGGDASIDDFDKVLNCQVGLAYRFYLWKSFARLNDHKRSKFNYVSFLVFTFGWLGMGLIGVLRGPEGYETYYVYLAGAGCMIFASAIIAYSRYQANLYGKFVSLRKDGLYQQTYAAVYQAKDSVLNESMPPIILSLLGSLAAGYFLDAKVALTIWNSIVLFFVIGNNIQIIRIGSKVADQEQQDKVRKSNPARNRPQQARLRRDMPEKGQKNSVSESYDVILIFVTALAAPLAVHVCDVTMGKENNPLSSEKLLCAYFALIAVYVIYEFLLSYYKQTWLWDRGWKFGNSDALIVSAYIVVAAIAISYYDTLGGTLFILAILLFFIIILLFKPDRVRLNSRSMVLFALIVSVVIPVILLNAFGSGILDNPGHLAWIWVGQLIVCIVFDGIYVLVKHFVDTDRQKQRDKE